MIRSRSGSKWKEVLGFDDEGDGILAYPSPPSSPPASFTYSGFRGKLRPSRSRETFHLRPSKSRESLRPQTSHSRQTFWSRSHTRSQTNQSRETTDSSESKETFGSRSQTRLHKSQSRGTTDTSTSIEIARPCTSPAQPADLPYPRFPKDITFFRSKGDVLLSPSSPAPSANDVEPLPALPHLFYITIQKDNPTSPISTARPDIILHSGPSKACTLLSLAKFHSVTQATDITLCPPAPKPISANFSNFSLPIATRSGEEKEQSRPRFKFESLSPSGGVFTTEKYSFWHTLPKTSLRERFEWRYTSGSFVRTVDSVKESRGLKLIRTSTGDVVAVYAGLGPSSRASNPSRVIGMFRFLRGECNAGLGGEFEALAIVSILSIVERNRRALKNRKQAFWLH